MTLVSPLASAPFPRRASALSGGGLSWQTMLADLALILFMVTAAAMGQPPPRALHHAETASAPGPLGEPVAVWRLGPGAPPLGPWLATQQADPRLALTITVRYGTGRYAPGGQAAALAQAGALAREAGAMGREARIVVEAANGAEVVATLAFDRSSGPSGTRFASPEASSSRSGPSNAQAQP